MQQTGWCINNKPYLSQLWSLGSPGLKVPSIQCLEKAHFQVLDALFPCCVLQGGRGKEGWGLFHKGT